MLDSVLRRGAALGSREDGPISCPKSCTTERNSRLPPALLGGVRNLHLMAPVRGQSHELKTHNSPFPATLPNTYTRQGKGKRWRGTTRDASVVTQAGPRPSLLPPDKHFL